MKRLLTMKDGSLDVSQNGQDLQKATSSTPETTTPVGKLTLSKQNIPLLATLPLQLSVFQDSNNNILGLTWI